MTYKINGTEVTIQPTEARWVPQTVIGEDGNGRPIYPAVHEFELRWQLVDQAQINQLMGFFNSVGNTGTAVVELPTYAGATYVFSEYSGTVIRKPEWNTFFVQGTTDVVLLITKIRVS